MRVLAVSAAAIGAGSESRLGEEWGEQATSHPCLPYLLCEANGSIGGGIQVSDTEATFVSAR